MVYVNNNNDQQNTSNKHSHLQFWKPDNNQIHENRMMTLKINKKKVKCWHVYTLYIRARPSIILQTIAVITKKMNWKPDLSKYNFIVYDNFE